MKKSEKCAIDRIKKLQKSLVELELDACIIDTPLDIFYMLGIELSLGRLLISKKKALLLVDGRYEEACRESSPIPVKTLDLPTLSDFLQKEKVALLGFDAENTRYSNYEQLKKALSSLKRKKQINTKLYPCDHFLKQLRSCKDDAEIRALKQSAKLLWSGMEYLKTRFREGVTEKDLAKEFEIFCLNHGAEELAFDTIVAFGSNTAKPHHHCTTKKLKNDCIILIDAGVKLNHYCSDVTRVFFYGKTSERLKKIYDVVHASQRAALKMCKPGNTLKELDLAARKVMHKAGMEEYFVHSLGHGVGLEVHEFPRISHKSDEADSTLKPGMVITIEPGLYIPKVGGVRYEDTIVITDKGYQNFFPEGD